MGRKIIIKKPNEMMQIKKEQRDFFEKHFVFHKKGEPVTIANSALVPTTELGKTFDEKEMRCFFEQAKRISGNEVHVVIKPIVEALLSNPEL